VIASFLEVGLSAVDPLFAIARREFPAMMLIGIVPHKSAHTAIVIEPGSNREVASLRVEASLGDYPPDAGLCPAVAAATVGY
jgi:hypothetical protein